MFHLSQRWVKLIMAIFVKLKGFNNFYRIEIIWVRRKSDVARIVKRRRYVFYHSMHSFSAQYLPFPSAHLQWLRIFQWEPLIVAGHWLVHKTGHLSVDQRLRRFLTGCSSSENCFILVVWLAFIPLSGYGCLVTFSPWHRVLFRRGAVLALSGRSFGRLFDRSK